MALLLLIGMPIIRAIMVYILPLVFKLLNRKFLLSSKELKICWFQGLVRGVIAFALCLQIDTQHKKFIMTIAMVIVMTTTLIGSTFMAKFVKFIKLEGIN
jgi:NhaP-type Na+/H+ or K+/H+ antiporter